MGNLFAKIQCQNILALFFVTSTHRKTNVIGALYANRETATEI